MQRVVLPVTIIVFLFFSSCYEKNIGNVSEFGVYEPEFSLPIGTPDIDLEQYLELIQLIPVPDTSMIPDSLLIYYEDQFWENPYILEYSFQQAFNIAVENDDSPVSSLMFRINAKNYIPAQIELQVYFLVDDNWVLDSLFNGPVVLEAATIDENGEVLSPFELFKKDTYIDDQKLDLFNQTNQLRISTRLIVEDIAGANPKYYSDQSIWLQMAARVKLNINLDE